jgi:hypothetical protein
MITQEEAASNRSQAPRQPVPGWVLPAALGGVAGGLMLGSSFLILPQPPALTAPLGQLVGYANAHHDLLLWVAWLEAVGSALFVTFLVALATTDADGRSVARPLTVLFGAGVLAVGLLYAICLIAIAESSRMGGTQLRTGAVAYGLWAACEHAFLLAPPIFLPLGFALRGSSALGSRFSATAIALGVVSIVLGLVGLFYARPQNAGVAGVAINTLIGLEAVWVAAAAFSLFRHRVSR